MSKRSRQSEELSYQTKTIIVVLLLIFAYPIGLIFMFGWMNWPLWFKLLIALPVVILLSLFVLFFVFKVSSGFWAEVSPYNDARLKQCQAVCKTSIEDKEACVNICMGERGEIELQE